MAMKSNICRAWSIYTLRYTAIIRQLTTVTAANTTDIDMLLPQSNTGLSKQIRFFYNRYAATHVVLIRVGSFYELFGQQALEWGPKLDLKLAEQSYTGFPHYRLEHYLAEMISYGMKVAIVEQTALTDSKEIRQRSFPSSNGLPRYLSQIITPGTFIGVLPNASSTRYLLSISFDRTLQTDLNDSDSDTAFGLTYCDVTSGEVVCCTTSLAELEHSIGAISPTEILLPLSIVPLLMGNHKKSSTRNMNLIDSTEAQKVLEKWLPNITWTLLDDASFDIQQSTAIDAHIPSVCQSALRGMTKYLYMVFDGKSLNLRKPTVNSLQAGFLDVNTANELELFSTKHKTWKLGSLHSFLDHTMTLSGARLLRQRLASPQLDLQNIRKRHDLIQYLNTNPSLCAALSSALSILSGCASLDMIVRLAQLSGKRPFQESYFRDVIKYLRVANLFRDGELSTLMQPLIGDLSDFTSTLHLFEKILCVDDNENVISLSNATVSLTSMAKKTPKKKKPLKHQDQAFIKSGHSERLDELRRQEQQLEVESKQVLPDVIAAYDLPRECRLRKSRTISSMPFIEVPMTHTQQLRDKGILVVDPIRRGKTSKAYFEKVTKVFGSLRTTRTQIQDMEARVLLSVREQIKCLALLFRTIDTLIAEADIGYNLAYIARLYQYTRPKMGARRQIILKDSYHPMVQQLCLLEGRTVTRNDCHLDASKQSMRIVSGPNMGGKSTYLRQVAVICLMAHIGSYIPAKSATIGLFFDAHDDIDSGKSTFMKELSDISAILHHATSRSLVLLDELGRGTTYSDGTALTASVIQWLTHHQIRCIITTHYPHFEHKLRTVLPSDNFKRITFWHSNVCGDKMNNRVYEVDLKLREGCIDRLYGLEIAGWTDLPADLLDMAYVVRRSMLQANVIHMG